MKRSALCLTLALLIPAAHAQLAPAAPSQSVPGDARPDAPELSARGPYAVGVRTLTLTPGQ